MYVLLAAPVNRAAVLTPFPCAQSSVRPPSAMHPQIVLAVPCFELKQAAMGLYTRSVICCS
jgi:hypothetical protein